MLHEKNKKNAFNDLLKSEKVFSGRKKCFSWICEANNLRAKKKYSFKKGWFGSSVTGGSDIDLMQKKFDVSR